MFLVDSHCHLDLLDFSNLEDDLTQVMLRAQAQGVKHILNVCVQLSQFQKILTIANERHEISASVGLHPNERDEVVTVDLLLQLGAHKKVVAIGETGLDYFRSTGELNWQQERFRTHIIAAKALNKPLIVHTREARKDTITILNEMQARDCGGVMHCFSEDWETAKKALDLGFYISFSGIITFKNATALQDLVKKIPRDRLLVETDAPYLAPHPHRGKQNEPAYVRYTAEYIATMLALPLEEFAQQTTLNFFTLFHGANQFYV